MPPFNLGLAWHFRSFLVYPVEWLVLHLSHCYLDQNHESQSSSHQFYVVPLDQFENQSISVSDCPFEPGVHTEGLNTLYSWDFVCRAVIPPVILFQSFHGGGSLANRRINLFKLVAPLIGLWEVLPQFLAPALSAINVFCLAIPASKLVTALFGGASPNTSVPGCFHHMMSSWYPICLFYYYSTNDHISGFGMFSGTLFVMKYDNNSHFKKNGLYGCLWLGFWSPFVFFWLLVSLDWTNISAGVNGAVEYLAKAQLRLLFLQRLKFICLTKIFTILYSHRCMCHGALKWTHGLGYVSVTTACLHHWSLGIQQLTPYSISYFDVSYRIQYWSLWLRRQRQFPPVVVSLVICSYTMMISQPETFFLNQYKLAHGIRERI
jgi:hypothetical protein